MTNADIIARLRTGHHDAAPWKRNLLYLVLSLALFLSLGLARATFGLLVCVTVTVFVHEMGHVVAMKIYGYKNIKMLLIPWFGGLASGEPTEQDAYKTAMVVAFGPFLGLVSVFLAICLAIALRSPWIVRYAIVAWYINVFNLLPITPLDGGYFVNEAILARYPRAQRVFRWVAVAVLVLLALRWNSILLGCIAGYVFIIRDYRFKMAVLLAQLRRVGGIQEGDLDEEKVAFLRAKIEEAMPFLATPRYEGKLPAIINNVWKNARKRFACTGGTLFLIFVYIGLTLGIAPFLGWVLRGMGAL